MYSWYPPDVLNTPMYWTHIIQGDNEENDHSQSHLLRDHFPLGRIFCAEWHFLLFEGQLAESERQKRKENIIPRGKLRLVENDPKTISNYDFIPFHPIGVNVIVTPFPLD